jgi:hypothetical protein
VALNSKHRTAEASVFRKRYLKSVVNKIQELLQTDMFQECPFYSEIVLNLPTMEMPTSLPFYNVSLSLSHRVFATRSFFFCSTISISTAVDRSK